MLKGLISLLVFSLGTFSPAATLEPLTGMDRDPQSLGLPMTFLQDKLADSFLSEPGEASADRWKWTGAWSLRSVSNSAETILATGQSWCGILPASAGLFVLERDISVNAPWRMLSFILSGEWAKARIYDLGDIGNPCIALWGGNGMHGSTLDLFRFNAGQLKKFVEVEGYGLKPALLYNNGEPVLVTYAQELPDACEACQSYSPSIGHLTAAGVVFEKNPFSDCLASSYTEGADQLDCLTEALKAQPDSFAILAHVRYLEKDGIKAKALTKRLKKAPVHQPGDEFCPEWNETKRKEYLEDLNE